MADTARLSLNAFLSHRYRSPEVNIYFYNLFSQRADVYFDVDLGTVATNVTRLERMIRGCDAFIGIYPYPGEVLVAPGHEELMKASRYFRLELDLAIRSRKPALVFYDRPDPMRLPSSLGKIHYLRAWEYPDLESLARRITEVFDEASTTAVAHDASAPSP
jgi:hypothetical protein